MLLAAHGSVHPCKSHTTATLTPLQQRQRVRTSGVIVGHCCSDCVRYFHAVGIQWVAEERLQVALLLLLLLLRDAHAHRTESTANAGIFTSCSATSNSSSRQSKRATTPLLPPPGTAVGGVPRLVDACELDVEAELAAGVLRRLTADELLAEVEAAVRRFLVAASCAAAAADGDASANLPLLNRVHSPVRPS